MVTTVISATFRGVGLIRGEALISMWIPRGAAHIRGWHLFETQHLLEEIITKIKTHLDSHILEYLVKSCL